MPSQSTTTLKLVIVDRKDHVLVERKDLGLCLPELDIPTFTRIAYAATFGARERWSLDIFVLQIRPSPIRGGSVQERDTLILLCRLVDDKTLPHCCSWVHTNDERLCKSDLPTIETAIQGLNLVGSGADRHSFEHYSSLDQLREWFEPYLEGLGVRETGIQQWNSGSHFSLVRIEVESIQTPRAQAPKAFWFKATGDPNARELAVTLALVEKLPSAFPKIVATKPDWNGWLMEDLDGHELAQNRNQDMWIRTASLLSAVQQEFIGDEARLLALGCCDWRMDRILPALDFFFEEMEETMERQPTDPPRKLTRCEMRDMKVLCRGLCRRIEDLGVPYTIAHGDFSPHNVIVSNGSPILIDWAEAYVTFPFISWEYFKNRMLKDHSDQVSWQEKMEAAYTERWVATLGCGVVKAGLRLSPAMAVLISALYGTGTSIHGSDIGVDKLKRSLLRRLQRELQTPNMARDL
jgi:hypothetical protein